MPLGIPSGHTAPSRCEVEHFTHVGTSADELGACGPDVCDDQPRSSVAAALRILAKMDRARRAGRRQLYDATAVSARQVGVQPPPQALVEALRAIDVRHGHDDDLEFHVDHPGAEYRT